MARAIASEDPHRASTADEYRAQVERIGRVLIDLLDRDPAVARILFYEAMGVSAELDEMMQRAWEAAGQVTAVYLRNGKDKGFLRQDLDAPLRCWRSPSRQRARLCSTRRPMTISGQAPDQCQMTIAEGHTAAYWHRRCVAVVRIGSHPT